MAVRQTYFTLDEVSYSYRSAVKGEYMDGVVIKTIKSIFGWEIE